MKYSMGAAGHGCLSLAGDLLRGEFVPSWCGVRGSIVSTVLTGICSVVPVGRCWGGFAQGPCLAVVARYMVGGRMRRGCLELDCVWSLRYVGVNLSAFLG
ncbi:hypothetical protein AMECASPLE_005430 [Ameca splendens]|uniref:Uncharacterized protein n=1 Tax=Ameca splendens TaxID=208324 RepID=A0ABV0YLX3_9TELE